MTDTPLILECRMGEKTARMIEMALRLLVHDLQQVLDKAETLEELDAHTLELARNIVPHATFVANDILRKLYGQDEVEERNERIAAFMAGDDDEDDRTLN